MSGKKNAREIERPSAPRSSSPTPPRVTPDPMNDPRQRGNWERLQRFRPEVRQQLGLGSGA